MDEQVRVAPDRRGEVEVVLCREPVVADVLGRVDGLHHRAEQELVQRALLRVALEALQQGVERAGIGRELGHLEAVGRRELEEPRELLVVRDAVHAVDGRELARAEPARHRLVRGEHELLDDPVRAVARALLDRHDLAVRPGPEDDLRLRQVEVDRAAAAAHRGELRLQLRHELERGAEPLAVRHLLAVEDARHLGVGAARGAPHHRPRTPRRTSSRPFASTTRSATMQSRSTAGLSEQIPFDSRSGSIGSTCIGK